MIYTIEGVVGLKKEQYAVIETGGIGFKVFLSQRVAQSLPQTGERVKLFCHFHMREDGAALFGFSTEQELQMFESLNSVSGIGPKSALGILGVAPLDQLRAAIKEGKIELLTKVSGVGRKTAERIVVDLRGKIESLGAKELVKNMESNADIEEALVNLGYSRSQARDALQKVDSAVTSLESRLKSALKFLKK